MKGATPVPGPTIITGMLLLLGNIIMPFLSWHSINCPSYKLSKKALQNPLTFRLSLVLYWTRATVIPTSSSLCVEIEYSRILIRLSDSISISMGNLQG